MEEFIKRYNIDYKQKENIKKLIKNYNIFDTKKEFNEKVKEYIENFNASEEIKKDMEEFTKKYEKEKIDDKMEKYIEEFIKRYNIDYKQKENIEKLIKIIIFLIRKKKENLILMNME